MEYPVALNSMKPLITFNEFDIFPLSKDTAAKFAVKINTALDQIPLVDKHTADQLLAETKGDRILYAKWVHSLIALTSNMDFAGIIIGYERIHEDNDQYPLNSIYLNDFAVSAGHQKKGLGKYLVKTWLDYNQTVGFKELDGKLRFSVQTNSAEWNKHVQVLYESCGFKKTATKQYDNRIDYVYVLDVE